MFYYLFHYLDQHFNFPGAGVFQYISFRAALALLSSLIITMVFGKRIINYIRKPTGDAAALAEAIAAALSEPAEPDRMRERAEVMTGRSKLARYAELLLG